VVTGSADSLALDATEEALVLCRSGGRHRCGERQVIGNQVASLDWHSSASQGSKTLMPLVES
jgi:hypothetical protein